jgi:hypothetical protein
LGSETPEEMFRKYINEHDLLMFKWRILKYMCEMCDKYETFNDRELFHRTDLKAFIDSKLSQEYLAGKGGTLYELVMTNVMNCLIGRNAVEISNKYPYGDSDMVLYKKSKKLMDLCNEFMKYEMGDSKLLDKLLPT